MDINLVDSPTVIYVRFVLNNFCEVNKELVLDDRVRAVMEGKQELQRSNHHMPIQTKETEGKCVRRVFTKYSDP